MFIWLHHDQHRVGASQVSCLHKLVMTSCSCPEKWRSALELPWEATVGKAKNKCQARVTEQHRLAGTPGEAEVGLEWGGSPLEWVLS